MLQLPQGGAPAIGVLQEGGGPSRELRPASRRQASSSSAITSIAAASPNDGILRTVLQLFVSMPEHVIVLRGNHEYYVDTGNRVSAGVAPAEAIATYAPYLPKQMFDAFRYLFERMPSMVIFGRILFVHAGIPRDESIEHKWRDLASLNDYDLRFQMMWSDPTNANHIPAELQRHNARFPFGKQQFRAFMERIGCHTMIAATRRSRRASARSTTKATSCS